jgi:hypothetical protein
MEQFWRVFQAFTTHMTAGHAMDIREWHCVHVEELHIRVEGVLVSPDVRDMVFAYPCGTFGCSECGEMCPMDETHGAWHHTEHGILCHNCSIAHGIGGVSMSVSIETSEFHPVSTVVRYEDRRPRTDIERLAKTAYYHSICEKVADVNDFVFLAGKTLADVVADRRARRVVTKWRDWVRRRRQFRLYRIFYLGAGLDLDGAMCLAKRWAGPTVQSS